LQQNTSQQADVPIQKKLLEAPSRVNIYFALFDDFWGRRTEWRPGKIGVDSIDKRPQNRHRHSHAIRAVTVRIVVGRGHILKRFFWWILILACGKTVEGIHV
jgi:hypothetical protein